MRLLDLFAGIGGFSLAAHWMGWETVAFVEKEPFCQKVLRKNFGQEIEIHDDIFTFSGKPFRGTIDIVTGGFPCQPFSAAGKRKGRVDERHLFPEMLRVISEVRPLWVVAENVRGLLSIESGAVFAEVVASLEGEGYEVITFCVPASALNAPHRRDRLWIVAHSRITPANTHASQMRSRNSSIGESGGDATNAHDAGNGASAGEPDAKRRPFGVERRDPQPQPIGHGCDDFYAESVGQQRSLANSRLEFARGESGIDSIRDSGSSADAQNAVSVGGRGRLESNGQILGSRRTEAENARSAWQTHWIEAATRLCGAHDGLSAELDIIGARDNRVSRLKALGNAVVPQIPFEIFRAIEKTERKTER